MSAMRQIVATVRDSFTFVQIDYHVGCCDDDNGDLTCIPELSLVSQDLQDSGLTLSFFLNLSEA